RISALSVVISIIAKPMRAARCTTSIIANRKSKIENEIWARQDSNLGPRDYESPALTAELQARDAIQLNHKHTRMTNLESVPSCSISEIPLASLPLACRTTQEPPGLHSVIL